MLVLSREPVLAVVYNPRSRPWSEVVGTASGHLVYAEHPDGITSYSGSDLHRQAWLAAALELPSPTVRSDGVPSRLWP